MKALSIVLCLILVFRTITCALDKIRLNEDGDFIDSQDRKVMFRGFNNVQKSPPFYDERMLDRARLAELKNRGFNIVRLGIIWHATHLDESTFNETYIDKMLEIVDLLAEHGMYVILDMHQDGLSSLHGTYDAMPRWIIERFPKVVKFLQYPWPLMTKPEGVYWFKSYLTFECQNSFQNLYDNVGNALDLWREFWIRISERFKDKDSVLGYELINEPFAGNFFKDPRNILPGYAGRNNLMPAYDRLVDGIRSVDKRSLIFYEPVTWGVFAPTSGSLGTGFERVPGTDWELARNTSVLSYHYYCWILQTVDPATVQTEWQKTICDDYLMQEVFKASEKSVEKTGGGRILTEFGLCAPDGNLKSINTNECEKLMKKADETFQSWNYWDSQFFDAEKKIRETPMRYFSRCYPQYTSGDYVHLQFEPLTGECTFKFTYRHGKSDRILELYLPMESHYMEGYRLDIEPKNLSWREVEDSKTMVVIDKVSSLEDGDLISIKVTRKSKQIA